MSRTKNNYAFIDSQNLNLAIRDQGWTLDFGRFRKYLADKYAVARAFLFIGFVPTNETLYTNLQQQGYILIFKPTLVLSSGRVKADGLLVTQAMGFCRDKRLFNVSSTPGYKQLSTHTPSW